MKKKNLGTACTIKKRNVVISRQFSTLMLISILIILILLLILFRVLRGESFADIHKEIKALKASEVPHYFLKSIKIVFSFKGPRFKKKKKDCSRND